MEEDGSKARTRAELLANVRRLTGIVLDKLEQGSKDHSLDQAQIRMLGSIALRSLRLWHEALRGDAQVGNGESDVLEAEAGLRRTLKRMEGDGA